MMTLLMRFATTVRFGLVICLLFSVTTNAQIDRKKVIDPQDIKLAAGDAVKMYVFDGIFPVDKSKYISAFHERELIINGFGEINLVAIGKVYVAGFTAKEISKILEEKFRPFAKEPRIVIEPLARIQLRGGFAKPGMYRFDLRMSFWEMVDRVGGFSGNTQLEDIYIVRKDALLYEDFENAFYDSQSLFELGLQSGDMIIAPMSNRLTFTSIMRYTQFGMSLLIFYFTLTNYQNDK